MKATTRMIFPSFLLALFAFTGVTEEKNPCLKMHEGTFTYKTGEGKATVVIKGNEHMEYHQNKKYYIKSTIKWVSDCEYETTLLEATLPDFPYKPGESLFVTITKVKGKNFYYACMINGTKYEGVFTKVK